MKFVAPSPESVRLADPVLAPRQEANRAATIPAVLKFCEETHRIDALRLAWALAFQEGESGDRPQIHAKSAKFAK